jgi:predicted DsbA family dithiol-disulfide isomerase
MQQKVSVYFDYLCPFAWRGAELARQVQSELEIDFEWQHFSLYQNNSSDKAFQLWNEKLDPADTTGTKGLLPFLASGAARLQGEELFSNFQLALLRARHLDHQPFSLGTVFGVAEESGLNLEDFERDLDDPELRTQLAQDHHRAVNLEVFGTPTFLFHDSGAMSYLRIRELPRSASEAVGLFTDFRKLLVDYPYLETIRRPRARVN